MYFPPADADSPEEEGEGIAEDDGAVTGDAGEKQMPHLPDVPTAEPTQAGQPDAKKPKLDRHDTRDEDQKL